MCGDKLLTNLQRCMPVALYSSRYPCRRRCCCVWLTSCVFSGTFNADMLTEWRLIYRVAQIKIPQRTKCNFSTTVRDFYTQIYWFIWDRSCYNSEFKKNYFSFLQSYDYITILCHIFNFAVDCPREFAKYSAKPEDYRFKCIGDAAKGAARRSQNCVKIKTKKHVLSNGCICPVSEILSKSTSWPKFH